ncbi:histidine phosphatase family protein [Kiloniella majae]|uniref:histidine phosphatase family protein n=1 Tax=Kiloniella majae TaxID=1938558 RepID=UPI000A27703C|nr:histidine phosphatase family protein [Kiloniella majae]
MIGPLPERSFCLIRHGETTANRDGIIAGHLEVSLTEQGIAEAKFLQHFQWPEQLTLYASPLQRAMKTAQLGFSGHEPVLEKNLRERDWGNLDGKELAHLCPRHMTPPDGEPWTGFIARTQSAITRILLSSDNKLPVIVAHSGTIRVVRFLIGLDYNSSSPANGQPFLYTPQERHWHQHELTPTTDITVLLVKNIKD